MSPLSNQLDVINQMVFTLPCKRFCEKRIDSITLFWSVGAELKKVQFNAKDFMQLLKKHGEDVVKSLITVHGPKGEPVQYERLVKVKWSEVEVSKELAYKIIARYEYEQAAKIAGIDTGAKVVPFYATSNKAA